MKCINSNNKSPACAAFESINFSNIYDIGSKFGTNQSSHS